MKKEIYEKFNKMVSTEKACGVGMEGFQETILSSAKKGMREISDGKGKCSVSANMGRSNLLPTKKKRSIQPLLEEK